MRARTGLARAVAAASAIASAACAATSAVTAPVATPGGVRFALIDRAAQSVALAGSFNGWSTSMHPLVRDPGSGAWSIVVALPPGEHAFMYVVDGERWITPPLAEDYIDDGFGSENGVVIVPPTDR